jgi:hypothetical protein
LLWSSFNFIDSGGITGFKFFDGIGDSFNFSFEFSLFTVLESLTVRLVRSGVTVKWLLVVFRWSRGWSGNVLVIWSVLESTFVTGSLGLLLSLSWVG